jgi:flavin-binding protein dodecin
MMITFQQRPTSGRCAMANRTYRMTEIVGTSTSGVDDAIRNGLSRANQTLRHMDWFEVTEVRGHIVDGEVDHFQVTLKIGFRLEDA